MCHCVHSVKVMMRFSEEDDVFVTASGDYSVE